MRGFLVGRGRAGAASAIASVLVLLAVGLVGGRGAAPARAAAMPPHPGPLRGGTLLVAAEKLHDPNFARTVVLLLEHDRTGAFGIIIDRPIGIELSRLSDLGGEPEAARSLAREVGVYRGGPVEPARVTLLLRAPSPPPEARIVLEGVYVSLSRRAFEWAAEANLRPGRVRAYVGYAGWGPGQLDAEFRNGDWHLIDATADTIFSANENELWKRLLGQARGTWVLRGGRTTTGWPAVGPGPRGGGQS